MLLGAHVVAEVLARVKEPETPGPIEVWKKEIALPRGLVGRRPRG